MNRREIFGLSFASLAATAISPLAAFGQAQYPTRPIKLIVPSGAGGVMDAVGRQWGERIKENLGTVVIENIGGAGGVIGTAEGARAAADGYTLTLCNTSSLVLNPIIMPKVPYDPVKDFAPITMLAVSTSAIIVHPSVPAKTLTEFVTYARNNQDKLSYASAGAGTMTNLAGELFKQLIGAPKIVHIPYKGVGPSLSDTVSGQVQMSTASATGQTLTLHQAGKIRILAVMAPQRLSGAPDIPTTAEAGMPGMVAQLFNGVIAPIKTPQAIIDRIYQASQKTMNDAGMRKAMLMQGLEPIVDSSPDKMRALLEEEHKRWEPALFSAGLVKK